MVYAYAIGVPLLGGPYERGLSSSSAFSLNLLTRRGLRSRKFGQSRRVAQPYDARKNLGGILAFFASVESLSVFDFASFLFALPRPAR
jgi:hypothetical protein